MVSWLRNIQIGYRLAVVIAIAGFGTLILSIVMLNEFFNTSYAERQLKTKHLVEASHSILSRYHTLATSGSISEDEAKIRAISDIRDLRYGDNDYFFILDHQPALIMHPIKPELQGKNLDQTADPNGKRLFREMVDVVENNGEGFVDYLWPKPGHEGAVEKVSFVKGFSPWNMIIGTGIYIDDMRDQQWVFLGRYITIVALLSLPLVGILILIIISIRSPLIKTLNAMENVAKGEGDLTLRLDESGKDELSKVATLFNQFVARTQSTIQEFMAASLQLNKLSEEMKDVVEINKHGTDQQKTETHNSASAITEMAASTDEIAKNAQQAADETTLGLEKSSKGSQDISASMSGLTLLSTELNNTKHVVSELTENSTKIGSILDVIRGIAEQTNLLALNAAIEAARAGEAGRGFAVVADEVRGLATRTQESTDEIQTMIEQIQNGVQGVTHSVDLAHNHSIKTQASAETAEKMLNEVNNAMQEITSITCQIAAATEEQASVANEISNNTHTIANLVDDGSTNFIRISDSTEEIRRLSQVLADKVSQFRV
ncbi:methyl-accepting chemotaxis protein [Alkalimarinus alittae]|uniref:Methyl-accepting chemotaxis protein n=1 Tax=Alkalimarinus alittae TaxID=2961619 RepID=A0ABY6MZM7_9ALTE|nr:methyl-accepting chemotaxis protein [Alkalimarinus alittae]UZE95293.1 methyl-accepting chemotaxis protein [Alkalimarinus alittae]